MSIKEKIGWLFQRLEADTNHCALQIDQVDKALNKDFAVNAVIVANVIRRAIEDDKMDKLRQAINLHFPEYLKTDELN